MALQKDSKRYKSSVGNIGIAKASSANYVSQSLQGLGQITSSTVDKLITAENNRVTRQDQETEDDLKLMYTDIQNSVKLGDVPGAQSVLDEMLKVDSTQVSNWTRSAIGSLGYGELSLGESVIISKGANLTNTSISEFYHMNSTDKYLALDGRGRLDALKKFKSSVKKNLLELYGLIEVENDDGTLSLKLKEGIKLNPAFEEARIKNYTDNLVSFDKGIETETNNAAKDNYIKKQNEIGQSHIAKFNSSLRVNEETNRIINFDNAYDEYITIVDHFKKQDPNRREIISLDQIKRVQGDLFEYHTNSIVKIHRIATGPAKKAIESWVDQGARNDIQVEIDGEMVTGFGYNKVSEAHPDISGLNDFSAFRTSLETRLREEVDNHDFSTIIGTVNNIIDGGGRITDANLPEETTTKIHEYSDAYFAGVSNMTLDDISDVEVEIDGEMVNYVEANRNAGLSDAQILSNYQFELLIGNEQSIFHKMYRGLTIDQKNKRNFISWINSSPENFNVAMPFILDIQNKFKIGGARLDTGSLFYSEMKDVLAPIASRYRNATLNRSDVSDLEIFAEVTNPPELNINEDVQIELNNKPIKLKDITFLDILDIDDVNDIDISTAKKIFFNLEVSTGGDPTFGNPYVNLGTVRDDKGKTLPKWFGDKEIQSAMNRFLLTDNGLKNYMERTFKQQLLNGSSVEDAQAYVRDEVERIYTIDPMSFLGVIPKNHSITVGGFNISTHGKKILNEIDLQTDTDIKDLEFGKDIRFGYTTQANYEDLETGEITLGNVYYPMVKNPYGDWSPILKKNGEPLAIHYAPKREKLLNSAWEERYREVETLIDQTQADAESLKIGKILTPGL